MPSDGTAILDDHSNNDDDDGDNDDINVSDNDLPKTPNCTQDTTQGTKCKASMMDQIAEVTKSKCQNHFKIATINTDAKTLCAIKKEKIKLCAVLELEVTHLQHNAQEAAANHAHEVYMMDRQIALEDATAGNCGVSAPYAPFSMDPNLH